MATARKVNQQRRCTASRWMLAIFFVAAGVNHFRSPAIYVAIMPPYLPQPLALVYISGIFEIAGGLGVLPHFTRRLAGWGLLALLVAVFPANLHMALHGFRSLPAWALWARLPLQLLLGAWVWHAALSQGARAASSRKFSPVGH